MINFLQFTENDKRLLIAIFLILILLFVIIGYLSLLVKKIMSFQAKTADDFLHDVYVTGVASDEKKLRNYGFRKNKCVFFRKASWPMLILTLAWLFIITYTIIFKDGNFKEVFTSFWNFGSIVEEGGKSTGGTGINTLFFVFDWSTSVKVKVLGGIPLPTQPVTINYPHLSKDAWYSYIFFVSNAVGVVWLLVCVQAYIARTFRIIKLSASIFKKTLDEKPMPSNELQIQQSESNNK